MTAAPVQIRHVTQFHYGESLAADVRATGEVPVCGSNGVVGSHEVANTSGPVIVVGRKGSHGKLNYFTSPVFAIDTTYFIDSSATSADLRWLYYALSTAQLEDLSQDVGVPGLSRDLAYSQRIPCAEPSQQRRIADFLDAETARIDALITAKQRMIDLGQERLHVYQNAWLESLAARFGGVPLKRVVELITVGIVVQPASWYAPSGVPALRGTNIRPGLIDTTDLVFLSPEGHAAHPKSSLRRGDVVVVRTGQAGAAAVVPRDLAGANCIDLLLVRPGARYDSDFLTFVLNSERTVELVREQSVGTIQAHFNVGSLAALVVPNAPPDAQRFAFAEMSEEANRVHSLERTLTRQIELLRERRQALITAAVTGELAV